MTKPTEEEIERTSVEQVFDLTGGEMADAPWYFGIPQEENDYSHPVRSATRRFWYEGVPEWATEDFPSEARGYTNSCESATYRTICETHLGYGGPIPTEIVDSQGVWKFVCAYGNSGERACVYDSGAGERVNDECVLSEDGTVCAYCEAEVGEKHGCIYLGDCRELVYRLAGENCDECGEYIPDDADAKDVENDFHLSSCVLHPSHD